MSSDVVDLILADHQELKRLFAEAQREGPHRALVVPSLVNLLTAHSRAEEAEVYPAALQAGIDAVQHSQKEHLEADQLAASVMEADPESSDFDSKLSALVEGVLHHIGEEESDVLPGIRAQLSREERAELGGRFSAVREEHLGAMPADITKAELVQQAQNAGVPTSGNNKRDLQRKLASAAEE